MDVRSKEKISSLQKLVEKLWSRLEFGNISIYPTERCDDGSGHVEYNGLNFDIIYTERGLEIIRYSNLTLLEAARHIIHSALSSKMIDLELKQRRQYAKAYKEKSGLDSSGYSRWNWMAPIIDNMYKIDPEFGDWAKEDYLEVLHKYPLSESEIFYSVYPLYS